MKIIALGGKGMTGSYLPESIPNYDLVDGYDIAIPGVLEDIFEKEKPEVVINLAAVTDVVGAETDQARCFDVNTIAAYRVALLCKKYKAKLVFISSVDVFDGAKKVPYEYNDKKNPIVVYGNSKSAAEAVVLDTYRENSLIIRCGWMFGGYEKDKKFVSYMMKQMLSGQPVIKAVSDVKGSPTYGKDLIKLILEIIDNGFNFTGIFHYCTDGKASRYDQAKLIAKLLCYKGKVEKASWKDFPTFRTLPYSVMESDFKTRPWKEALTEYITLWKERIK